MKKDMVYGVIAIAILGALLYNMIVPVFVAAREWRERGCEKWIVAGIQAGRPHGDQPCP